MLPGALRPAVQVKTFGTDLHSVPGNDELQPPRTQDLRCWLAPGRRRCIWRAMHHLGDACTNIRHSSLNWCRLFNRHAVRSAVACGRESVCTMEALDETGLCNAIASVTLALGIAQRALVARVSSNTTVTFFSSSLTELSGSEDAWSASRR